MDRNPGHQIELERENLRELANEGEISTECCDILLEYADAVDRTKARHQIIDEDGNAVSLSLNTAKRYVANTRIHATHGIDFSDTSADEVNDVLIWMHDEAGKSDSTLATYVGALKLLFEFRDLGVEPENLRTFSSDSSPRHDQTDLFDDSDIQALRQAAEETRFPKRDRAFLELLIFTGQRVTALLTLRMEDVDVEEGYIYLNAEYADKYDGLKGALRRGRKRPMFGAKKSVQQYKRYHPYKDHDNPFFFVSDPKSFYGNPEKFWSKSASKSLLRRLKEMAEIEKPTNPHNFRHYFATIMYRDYGLRPETIKMLLGHVKGSTVFETTYSHVIDADHIATAEEAVGIKEPESSNPLTPEICPTCNELLQDDWRACPSCGEEFGPAIENDIDAAADNLQDEVTDRALDSDTDLSEGDAAVLDAVLDAVDDPDALANQLRQLGG
ncbi:site-specific integrase (plasmid) [Halococcus dombrowskii]|uniref:Site-specific integrase n=1 Tax=Halococcus dombrowskii TaxID=179637 RepID=A0AAV3SLI2_HALDO|nr:site-specific integrase [Halococcus dombrowskii]UOO97075.1 site-specific integrase [Halococcus dombrowskii]